MWYSKILQMIIVSNSATHFFSKKTPITIIKQKKTIARADLKSLFSGFQFFFFLLFYFGLFPLFVTSPVANVVLFCNNTRPIYGMLPMYGLRGGHSVPIATTTILTHGGNRTWTVLQRRPHYVILKLVVEELFDNSNSSLVSTILEFCYLLN